jgi:hypothetical protein
MVNGVLCFKEHDKYTMEVPSIRDPSMKMPFHKVSSSEDLIS